MLLLAVVISQSSLSHTLILSLPSFQYCYWLSHHTHKRSQPSLRQEESIPQYDAGRRFPSQTIKSYFGQLSVLELSRLSCRTTQYCIQAHFLLMVNQATFQTFSTSRCVHSKFSLHLLNFEDMRMLSVKKKKKKFKPSLTCM